jgi:hypothetical protein
MRKRLIAIAAGILGLGVPIMVAWLSRRGPRPWDVGRPDWTDAPAPRVVQGPAETL